jgi:hypothetical protein
VKLFAAIVLMFLLPAAASAADARKATDAAKSWVVLLDAKAYARSWNAASGLFQSHVPQEQWERAVQAARGPMGALVSRHVAGAEFAGTLPGAPDGQYVVVRFDTKFAHKAAAIETVTMVLDNGSWKSAGYYVR